MMQIIGFLKLSISASASGVPKQSEEDILQELVQDKCKYTEDCTFLDDILLSDDRRSDREYRGMEEKYFRMFELMLKRPEPYKYECVEEGKRVVELQYLYNNRPDDEDTAAIFESKSPGKWLDYVIFYALEKRHTKIEDDDIFLGVAIYSEFYCVYGKYRDILLENLFDLYIKGSIINNPEGFYNSIYTRNGNREDLRDDLELELLENVMKKILLKVPKILDIPCSVDREGIDLRIYERIPSDLEGFYSKRGDNHLVVGSDINCELVTFRNVIMEKVPSDSISDDYKNILLMLIGMVRTGKNIVTARCMDWVMDSNFSQFLRLVNTNRNLVGVTELDSEMNLEGMLGGIKGQLRYLEVNFGLESGKRAEVTEFIKSLNGVMLKISLYYWHLGAKTLGALLASRGVRGVIRLKVLNVYCRLDDPETLNTLCDPKIFGLELYKCSMSLEGFLLSEDFSVLRSRLRVLEVSGIGSIIGEKITDANLESLRLERLYIFRAYFTEEDVMNLDQLIKRDVITRDGFKYLVFKNIHHKDRRRIVDLRNRLGEREWPVVLTSFRPQGAENKDFTRICWGYFYELSSERN